MNNSSTIGMVCRYCGSPDIDLVPKVLRTGVVQSMRRCRGCNRRLGFVPQPWSVERARSFVLPWGKYRGHSVGELAGTQAGKEYLAWLVSNTTGNAAIAGSIALGLMELGEVES